ncbi:hypothetical protein FRB90_000564 [Tulasnella sp. 427]|nr:hypothetical protein FRB90_000564 [Tulasnella sp. 427]
MEDARQRWLQKQDIDWYTACNDEAYRAIVSHWMRENLIEYRDKEVASPGETLRMTFLADVPSPVSRPVSAKGPLPDDTIGYLEATRRKAYEAPLMEAFQSCREWEARVLDVIDSSDKWDGSSYVCEVASVGGVAWGSSTQLRLKVFDDRRIGDLSALSGEIEVAQWHRNARLSQSEVLAGLEHATYRHLSHVQGSAIPISYGMHQVVLLDGTVCWAILTELVQGNTPQALPRGVPTPIKYSAVTAVRHALRVLQYAEVTKPKWRFGDIQIYFFQASYPGAPVLPACSLVNLRQARISTVNDTEKPNDDFGEIRRILALSFGNEVVEDSFGERESWDYYANPAHVDFDANWTPDDYERVNQLEEDPQMYRPGGYHPVQVRELYHDRYRITRKLGWGQYSTVWLAQDLRSSRYVAIKILQSQATSAMEEFKVLDLFANDPLAWENIAEHLDTFTHEGPFGEHQCIVFELLGVSLRDFLKSHPERQLGGKEVRSIAKQLLLALKTIHKQGIIHTDIKQSNLLIVVPDIDIVARSSDVPEAQGATNTSPSTKYSPLESRPLSTTIPEGFKVKLADFGSAQPIDGKNALWPIQPQLLRAPEVILDAGWGAPADIWNFACLIFEIYSNHVLFDVPPEVEVPPEYIQLALMQSMCGGFPEGLLSKGRLAPQYFDPQTGQVDGIFFRPIPLRQAIEGWMKALHSATDAEIDLFSDFLGSMLKLEPSDRPSAAELLEHPWLSL